MTIAHEEQKCVEKASCTCQTDGSNTRWRVGLCINAGLRSRALASISHFPNGSPQHSKVLSDLVMHRILDAIHLESVPITSGVEGADEAGVKR